MGLFFCTAAVGTSLAFGILGLQAHYGAPGASLLGHQVLKVTHLDGCWTLVGIGGVIGGGSLLYIYLIKREKKPVNRLDTSPQPPLPVAPPASEPSKPTAPPLDPPPACEDPFLLHKVAMDPEGDLELFFREHPQADVNLSSKESEGECGALLLVCHFQTNPERRRAMSRILLERGARLAVGEGEARRSVLRKELLKRPQDQELILLLLHYARPEDFVMPFDEKHRSDLAIAVDLARNDFSQIVDAMVKAGAKAEDCPAWESTIRGYLRRQGIPRAVPPLRTSPQPEGPSSGDAAD